MTWTMGSTRRYHNPQTYLSRVPMKDVLRTGSSVSKAEKPQADTCCLGRALVSSCLLFQRAAMESLGSAPIPLPPACTHRGSTGSSALVCHRTHAHVRQMDGLHREGLELSHHITTGLTWLSPAVSCASSPVTCWLQLCLGRKQKHPDLSAEGFSFHTFLHSAECLNDAFSESRRNAFKAAKIT